MEGSTLTDGRKLAGDMISLAITTSEFQLSTENTSVESMKGYTASAFRRIDPGSSIRFVCTVCTPQYTVIKYQQQIAGDPNSFYVPRPAWSNAPTPPKTGIDVHHLIRDFLFRHAATISAIG